MLVEYARNCIGLTNAVHAEYGIDGDAIVTLLACSLNDQTIDVAIAPGSLLETVYGSGRATERTTCNYGDGALLATTSRDNTARLWGHSA